MKALTPINLWENVGLGICRCTAGAAQALFQQRQHVHVDVVLMMWIGDAVVAFILNQLQKTKREWIIIAPMLQLSVGIL